MAESLLQMGRIGKPHGIKGAVTADWFGEYEPGPGDSILLKTADGSSKSHNIEAVSRHKNRLILKLTDTNDRDAAAAFTGKSIWLSKTAVPPPEDDEVFLADLPGCSVLLENGLPLGSVDHLECPAGQFILAILTKDGREILLPGQPEFIKKMDLAKKEIVVSPPEGLLEIYCA